MTAPIISALRVVRQIQRWLRVPGMRAERDAAIVTLRDAGWSFDELSAALGMSREHIRQIDQKTRSAAELTRSA